MIDAEANAAAAQAAKELRVRARVEHRGNTQPLMVVYAVESFLRRLAESDHAGRMVLKSARGRRHGEFVILDAPRCGSGIWTSAESYEIRCDGAVRLGAQLGAHLGVRRRGRSASVIAGAAWRLAG